jgi:hypothetical protein
MFTIPKAAFEGFEDVIRKPRRTWDIGCCRPSPFDRTDHQSQWRHGHQDFSAGVALPKDRTFQLKEQFETGCVRGREGNTFLAPPTRWMRENGEAFAQEPNVKTAWWPEITVRRINYFKGTLTDGKLVERCARFQRRALENYDFAASALKCTT